MDVIAAEKSFVFDVDREPVDEPPVLFHTIRVPCACGQRLTNCRYTFFASAVFVRGVCTDCGERTAIFAPHEQQMDVVDAGASVAADVGTNIATH